MQDILEEHLDGVVHHLEEPGIKDNASRVAVTKLDLL
jgi:hypothetical protein